MCYMSDTWSQFYINFKNVKLIITDNEIRKQLLNHSFSQTVENYGLFTRKKDMLQSQTQGCVWNKVIKQMKT